MAGGGLLEAFLRERMSSPRASGRRTDDPRAGRLGKFLPRRTREGMTMSGAKDGEIPRPHNADWAWRPELWRGPLIAADLGSVLNRTRLGDGITIFHDCHRSDLTLSQQPDPDGNDGLALVIDVSQFEGTFLSVVVDLPLPAIRGLKRLHLIRMNAVLELERAIRVFARLNVAHGPNTERIVRALPSDGTEPTIEFDLAYTELNERRVEKAWVDLIFETPGRNRITLRDLTFARRPRAAF